MQRKASKYKQRGKQRRVACENSTHSARERAIYKEIARRRGEENAILQTTVRVKEPDMGTQ
jgi:hypothetical protein